VPLAGDQALNTWNYERHFTFKQQPAPMFSYLCFSKHSSSSLRFLNHLSAEGSGKEGLFPIHLCLPRALLGEWWTSIKLCVMSDCEELSNDKSQNPNVFYMPGIVLSHFKYINTFNLYNYPMKQIL
jgi:hypothetical protein